MADRVAVYAGTRNIYDQMSVCLTSLLSNTAMDRVYLLIEDDEFPYTVPSNVIVKNISSQEYFKPGSPNFKSAWGYMTMIRCCLGSMLPDEDMVLWLDCDTIVTEDISDIFELDMTGYHYAGVMEPGKSKGIFHYVNCGVLLCHLALLRPWEKELEEQAFLNCYEFQFPDQDVINLLCQGRIREIGSEYNFNPFVLATNRPKIIHFAAQKDFKEHWAYKRYELIRQIGGEQNG